MTGNPPDSFNIIVFDGGALVHLLSTVNIITFNQYADNVVILKQLERSTRVDVVWDTYISLIVSQEKRRGKASDKR